LRRPPTAKSRAAQSCAQRVGIDISREKDGTADAFRAAPVAENVDSFAGKTCA
jgi:hypothetical protein